MTVASSFPNAPDLTAEDYVVLGLATCYLKSDGEIHEVKIAEPIPSAALEAILKGIATSYEMAIATSLGDVIQGNNAKLPQEFPIEAQPCDGFAERLTAAARTYKARAEAQSHIPKGAVYRDFNFSLERKRILNSERIIKAEDNVKQHSYTHKVL
ncbi:MAG: hypothetical protein ACFE0J_02865 [Elainellaceae cyanobacterium]